MKKLILTAGICISSLLCVQAQQTVAKVATPPTASQQVDKALTNMTSTCKLTPEQVTKVKPILTEFVNARMANKQQYGSDKAKMKQANKANAAAMKSKLAKVLTPDQQTKWAAFVKQQKAEKQSAIRAQK